MALSYGQKDYGNPYAKYQAPKQSKAPAPKPTSGYGSANYGNPYATPAKTSTPKTSSKSNSSSKSNKSSSSNKSTNKDSNKSTSVVDTSQRSLADVAKNNPYGGAPIPAPVKGGIKASNPTSLGKGLQWINEAAGYGYGKLTGAEDPMLGLTHQVMGGDAGFSESDLLAKILGFGTVNAMLRDDPSSGGNYKDPNTTSAINYDEIGGQGEQRAINQQRDAGNTNPITNYSKPDYTSKYTPTSSQPTRKSQPVSNPWTNPYQQVAPTQETQSSMYSPDQTAKPSYSPQSTPDYGNTRTNERTMRGMGGQGIFSKGTFSNGSGDYGFQGTMGEEGGDSDQDILNKLLGINTAEAGGFEGANPYQQNYANSDMYKQTMASMYPNGVDNYQTPSYQNTGGNPTGLDGAGGSRGMGGQMKVGGNQQANDSGEDYSYNAQMKLQEKSYTEQKKAQERALKELIKSITGQYDQSETETRGAMGKQNQEDMLKLSGLFGFANQDPNSEQRMQYEQRAQNDFQSQLANAMTKLGTARAGDISGANQNYQSQVASLSERRAQAIQAIQQEQRQYQQRMQEMQMKAQPKARTSAPKTSPKKSAALYAPDGSYTFNERDPQSGLKIFYDENNQPFINS